MTIVSEAYSIYIKWELVSLVQVMSKVFLQPLGKFEAYEGRVLDAHPHHRIYHPVDPSLQQWLLKI